MTGMAAAGAGNRLQAGDVAAIAALKRRTAAAYLKGEIAV